MKRKWDKIKDLYSKLLEDGFTSDQALDVVNAMKAVGMVK